jgi:hypothetical protein
MIPDPDLRPTTGERWVLAFAIAVVVAWVGFLVWMVLG